MSEPQTLAEALTRKAGLSKARAIEPLAGDGTTAFSELFWLTVPS